MKYLKVDLLNEVVSVIKANPHIKKLSIEGHTDSDGSEKHNQKLSNNRASAIKRYLVENGTIDSMLEAKGVVESKPIADNETDEGRKKNRRIVFIITEQDKRGKTYETNPKTDKDREVKKEIAQ